MIQHLSTEDHELRNPNPLHHFNALGISIDNTHPCGWD